jgi:hypothetical protein
MWVHVLAMTAVIIMTLVSAAFASFVLDSVEVADFHRSLGGFMAAVALVQGVCGVVVWVMQTSSRVRPDFVHYANTIHHILGYAVMVIVAIVIMQVTFTLAPVLFWLTLIIGMGGILAFIVYKFCFKSPMQKYNSLPTDRDAPISQVTTSRELAKLHGNYFIFADNVYGLDRVLTSHPGGFEVINRARGRELDRYIYGSEALEGVGAMQPHSHSAASIDLAGPPIATLSSINPYRNLFSSN